MASGSNSHARFFGMSGIPRFSTFVDTAYSARAQWRAAIVPPPAPADTRAAAAERSSRRWPWARLLHDRSGGWRRILGAVTEPHAVRWVLVMLGLAAEPPPGGAVPAA
jgi:hypothetical protein